jgi:hypothetical protein
LKLTARKALAGATRNLGYAQPAPTFVCKKASALLSRRQVTGPALFIVLITFDCNFKVGVCVRRGGGWGAMINKVVMITFKGDH